MNNSITPSYDKIKSNKCKRESIRITVYMLSITLFGGFACRERYFNVGNYFLFPLIFILIGFISTLYKVMRINKITKPKIEQYCVFIILLYILITSCVLQYDYKIDSIKSYIILFLLFFVTTLLKVNKRELIFIIKSYILSAIVLSTILIIKGKMLYEGTLRLTIFFSRNNYYDVNFLAAYILFPALIALNNAIIQDNKIKKIKYYMLTLVLLIAIFLTGSRASLIGFIIGATYMLIINKKVKINNIIAILVICAIIYFLLPSEIIDRFFGTTYNDGSNQKRLKHWFYAIKVIMKKPLLGWGITWTTEIIKQEFKLNYAVHNTILGFLVQFGIIGSLPIIIIIANGMRLLYKNKEIGFVGAIVGFIFTIIMVEAQNSLILFFPLMITYLIIGYKRNNNCDQLKF